MSRKKIIPIIIVIVLAILVIAIPYKKKVTFYYIIINPSESIDIEVKVDNEVVFSDSAHYSLHFYGQKEINLKRGFHNINVNSNLGKISKNERILVLLNQSFLINFYREKSSSDSLNVNIRNKFGDFLPD